MKKRHSWKTYVIALMCFLFARRVSGARSHAERVLFLAAGIVASFAKGAFGTALQRLLRGSAFHEEWGFAREVTIGASRSVIHFAQDLFENDQESYRAWTTLLELVSRIPMRVRLRASGLQSLEFFADGVPCAAIFQTNLQPLILGVLDSSSCASQPCNTDSKQGVENVVVLLHFHGGGYVSGGIASAQQSSLDFFSQAHNNQVLARRVMIVHVDYALGPECQYPQAVIDGVKVFDWLTDLGFSAGNIFLMGESAGGGLAACVTLALRDVPAFLEDRRHELRENRPAGAILLSPMIDLSHELEYNKFHESHDIIQGKLALGCAKAYCPETECFSPYASPVHAEFLGELPPILVQTGDVEIFHESCERFSTKAQAHGSLVKHESFLGMPHCFHFFLAAGCQHSAKAYQSIYSFLASHSIA